MLPSRRNLETKRSLPAAKSDAPSSSREQKRNYDNAFEEKGSDYLRRKHQFVRSTIRVDYQPDICKDYKETGFCGFGDSCKFLHDRSDYKHGWQLEQEWRRGDYKDEDEDKYLIKDEDDLEEQDPSVCPICHEEFTDPIVTKCKHFFCGSCADKECSDKCFSCQNPTSGIFKVAKIAPKKSPKGSNKQTSESSNEAEENREIDHKSSPKLVDSDSDCNN